jgi:hypothetical protein
MIGLIKDTLEKNGSATLHFNNGETLEIISLEVRGMPDHTYHVTSADGTKAFFDTTNVISFVSLK